MQYTPAMLARLTYSHAAYESSDRLASEASTYGDEYGCGAFITEEAATIVSEAQALLESAVVADNVRGASWPAVADALDVSAGRRAGDSTKPSADFRFAREQQRETARSRRPQDLCIGAQVTAIREAPPAAARRSRSGSALPCALRRP